MGGVERVKGERGKMGEGVEEGRSKRGERGSVNAVTAAGQTTHSG